MNHAFSLFTAEYILSLGNLSFSTFSGAITEKYEDLYFEEDLVLNLFDAVNGRRPVAERRSTPHNTDVGGGGRARVISVEADNGNETLCLFA